MKSAMQLAATWSHKYCIQCRPDFTPHVPHEQCECVTELALCHRCQLEAWAKEWAALYPSGPTWEDVQDCGNSEDIAKQAAGEAVRRVLGVTEEGK